MPAQTNRSWSVSAISDVMLANHTTGLLKLFRELLISSGINQVGRQQFILKVFTLEKREMVVREVFT